MCTPAVRAILFKLLTNALQAPMRVNVTSKRIPTHPGIKVKSGNKSRLFPVMKRPGISNFVFSTEVVPENS